MTKIKIVNIEDNISYVKFGCGKAVRTDSLGVLPSDEKVFADYNPNGKLIGLAILRSQKQ